MVRAHHGYLGTHHRADGVHSNADALLYRSHPTGRCRSRLFPRHPRVPHTLVSGRRPRQSLRHVHDCHSRSQHHRLAAEERDWITAELDREAFEKKNQRSYKILEALRQPTVIQLTLIYFFAVSSIYSLSIWLPTFLKRASGMSNLAVTMLSIIPYVAVLLAMLFNGWHSDRTNERRWHTAIPLILGTAAFALTILSGAHFWFAFACLTVASTANAFLPSFWPVPSAFLGESAAAASIGLINSIGNLGSFVTPSVIGYFLDRTHSFTPGFLYVIGSLLVAIFLILTLRMRPPDKKT